MSAIVEGLARALAYLPTPVLYRVADLLALIIGRIISYRSDVIDENIARSFTSLSASERAAIRTEVYRNFADVLVEIVRGRAISKQELLRRVQIDGLEQIQHALSEGRSALLLAAHHCNWEWLLLACSIRLCADSNDPALRDSLWALYKPLHDERVDRFMLEVRGRFGRHQLSLKMRSHNY